MMQRKNEQLDYNRQTFANRVSVLPKFSTEESEAKKWWKHQTGFDSNPNKSAKELMLSRKVHGVEKLPEAMIMADHSQEAPPADSFKAVHFPKAAKPTG